jgi:hypothetical protein
MTKFFVLAAFVFSAQFASAQLQNTTWTGIFKVPDEMESVLQFTGDTMVLKTPADLAIETMTYRVNKDTITILKLDGNSGCSLSKPAIYKYAIKNNRLIITAIDDDCEQRAAAWPVEGLDPVK